MEAKQFLPSSPKQALDKVVQYSAAHNSPGSWKALESSLSVWPQSSRCNCPSLSRVYVLSCTIIPALSNDATLQDPAGQAIMIRCFEARGEGTRPELVEVSVQPSQTVWHLPGEGPQIFPSVEDALSQIFHQDSQVREHLGGAPANPPDRNV